MEKNNFFRKGIVSILVIIFIAIIIFNVSVIYFAHKQGLFHIIMGPKVEPADPREEFKTLYRAIEAKQKELHKQKEDMELETKKLEDLKQKISLEKSALIAQKTEVVNLLKQAKSTQDKKELAEKQKREKNIKKLSKIYSSMKAKDVVPIFEKLDDETVVSILMTMKAKDSAKILGAMPPKRSSIISKKVRGK